MTNSIPQGNFHIAAKPDYRVDQIRRYMRRHQNTAMFINGPVEQCLNLDEIAALTRREIKEYFNAARAKGENQ